MSFPPFRIDVPESDQAENHYILWFNQLLAIPLIVFSRSIFRKININQHHSDQPEDLR